MHGCDETEGNGGLPALEHECWIHAVKSNALPSFRVPYRSLDKAVKGQARKAYGLWAESPFHPSPRFKRVNAEEDVERVIRTI